MPIMIELHLEAYCNDNCEFCSFRAENGTNPQMLKLIDGESHLENKPIGRPSSKSRIPYDVVMKLPKIMSDCNIPACILSGGGEPTIYPQFDGILDELIKHKIEVGLITNGSGLSKDRVEKIAKHFKWIRMSMDASDQETHKKIHLTPNNDFDRRLRALFGVKCIFLWVS
jgi:wyosine [tRNA(Phe)-imidazoG37] synthetase (radical SAM superfamily)